MKNKIIYSGKFPSESSKLFEGKFQDKSFALSEYQKKLFSIATLGWDAFSEKERRKLSERDKEIVRKNYGITKRILNDMRQKMITNTINKLFASLFPNAQGAALPILLMNVTDPTMTSRVSLKVPKEALIKRLVQEGVLPSQEFKSFAA